MNLREGAHASYVGYETGEREVGDRCLVLSCEANHSEVKWVTGSLSGSYDRVSNIDLVADRPPARHEDEFTFESYSNRIVNTACLEVFERRGESGLLRALDKEGHYQGLVSQAISAISYFASSLDSDPVWSEIEDSLGEESLSFKSFLIRKAIGDAMNVFESPISEGADDVA